jgi:hypothetical protein
MRKRLYATLVATVLVASFGPLAAVAAAEGGVMCTLEEKGIVHSPMGSFCHENPWDAR